LATVDTDERDTVLRTLGANQFHPPVEQLGRLPQRKIGLSEGNIFAGEFLTPQMYLFRPTPGWNQYRTPINGYYQCGSGTHPGGCVMGAPERLAARQILGDLSPGGHFFSRSVATKEL
jgi:hypothetical protein